MEICLLSPAPAPGLRLSRPVDELAAILARRHSVTVVHLGPAPGPPIAGVREVEALPDSESRRTWWRCPEHEAAALAYEALRRAYPGRGPDYLEAPDCGAAALVALQARSSADPLLAGTTIALRAGPSAELQRLHDQSLRDSSAEPVAGLEREALREADLLLAADAEALGLYERFYAEPGPPTGRGAELPRRALLPAPLALGEGGPAQRRRLGPGEPLRLLCLGPLSRAGGTLELLEACLGAASDGWELTLAGADTPTAAMGQSVREVAETLAEQDSRVSFEDEPGPRRLAALLAGHHLLVAPDRLCVDAAPALRALAAGLPLLTTPVGELAELVEPGANGWLCDGLGPASLRAALERVLDDPAAALDGLEPPAASAARARARVDGEAVLDAYDAVLAERSLRYRPPAPASAEPRLVSILVPYFAAHEHVEAAVASALAQTHRELEILVVDDGSFGAEDIVLERLAEQPRVRVLSQINAGESAARNLGATMARGDYLVLLDADNALEPGFVERALAAFARNPELAYVSCWQRVIGPDGEPLDEPPGSAQLGNRVLAGAVANFDADTMAMVRRSLFVEEGEGFDPEGAMHSDWEFFRRLRRNGRFGVVIPERLGRYRVLSGSLMRGYGAELQEVAWAQSLDRIELSRTRWTAVAGG